MTQNLITCAHSSHCKALVQIVLNSRGFIFIFFVYTHFPNISSAATSTRRWVWARNRKTVDGRQRWKDKDFGPHENRKQTREDDKHRDIIEQGMAYGEKCNLKARDQNCQGPADEIKQKVEGLRKELERDSGPQLKVCRVYFLFKPYFTICCLFPP